MLYVTGPNGNRRRVNERDSESGGYRCGLHQGPAQVQLERLLRSIASQSRKPHEVLIVDNAPATERTRNRMLGYSLPVATFVSRYQGLDFARNRALREATGRVIAFIDDDAVANSDWVEASERVFAESPSIAYLHGEGRCPVAGA